ICLKLLTSFFLLLNFTENNSGGLNLFYGTRWFYKILYFITAMSPAYFLFLIQIDEKFSKPLNYNWSFKDVTLHINVFWWCGLLFIIILALTFLLKFLLIRQ